MALGSLIGGWLGRVAARFGKTRNAPLPVPDRVVLGLGNPGAEYADTRHNVGFRVVERLAGRHGADWRDDPELKARTASIELRGLGCLLVEPQTFMNRSGETVAALVRRWPALEGARDLWVVFDDLDLPPGRIRLRADGGAGGQRGMADILRVLETRAVPRLRFGIGRPAQRGAAIVDWVLTSFGEDEQAAIDRALEGAADAIEVALVEGVERAMGRFNAKG
jgi:PTH1 family peptidyl-tRNA hydrolase